MRPTKFKPSLLVNKGRIESATYRDAEVGEYEGNPLIEALPPIMSEDDAAAKLARFPTYNGQYRSDPNHLRFHHIQSGMRFFAPLPVHLDIERRFSCLIRGGYLGRNPLAPGFWNDINDRVDSLGEDDLPQPMPWSTAAGFNIVGVSGIGKSLSLLSVLNLYPQVIHHGHYHDRDFTLAQLVWLKLDCPSDGGIRGLCINFFQAVDDILGTTYRNEYASGRRTIDEMLPDMALVASVHCLGVFVIDEIQRLSHAKSGGIDRMLSFFVQLVNTIGVPVVLVGTYKAMHVLTGEFSNIRRGTGQGDLVWDRMDEDEVWQYFVETLWKYQYTRTSTLFSEELSHTLYEETQGITDFAVKLYMLAQVRAITTGKEVVTPSIIRSVAKDSLRLAAPVLAALKSGDYRALSKIEDIHPIDFDRFLQGSQKGQVIGNLRQLQPTSGQSTGESNPEIGESAQQPATPSVEAAPQDNTSAPVQPQGAAPHAKQPAPPPSGMLKAVKDNRKLPAYEALRVSGYIRNATEFLEGRVVA